MGVYGILKNYSRGHDFNLDWKDTSPSFEYIDSIGKVLGWNLQTDLIIFETDYGYNKFVGNSWVLLELFPIPFEKIIDEVFADKRNKSGWLTLDQIKLEEMCKTNTFSENFEENIEELILSEF